MSKKKDSLKPWLSRPAVNRSVTLPLTRPLTQRLSNLNEFHPNELDPYLLFDARDSMVGTLENPTLDLDPSKPDTLNVITATRSGTATYTDVNGNIATAAADTVRVDYTQGEELTPTKFQRIGYTDFSSGVTLDGVIKTNQSTPYGDGVLLTQDSSSGEHNINISVTSTGQHTFSLKVKPNGVTKFSLSLEFSTSNSEVVYDTAAETSGIQGSNVSDASIENLGDGWFLAKLTNDSAVSTARVRLRDNSSQVNYLGDGASGLFLTNPQVEEGTTASDFVENTTGSPKFTGISATYGPRVPMILCEPSATNLVTYSEDFSHSSWTKTAATMEGGHTAPDGTASAYKLIEDTTDSIHRTYQTATVSVSPSASISVFVKYNGRRYVLIRFADQGVGRWYDLITGTLGSTYLGTPNDSSIELIGNDWYRITLSHTSNAQARCEFWVSDTESTNSYQGDGTSGVYIWGAQLETGSVATSYIPTSGSTVTRQADDLVITGSDFTDFYNDSEGTFYLEGVPQNLTDDTIYWMDTAPSSERIAIYDTVANAATIYVDGISSSSATVYPPNQLARLAISVKSNFQELSINGGTSVTLGVSSLPSPTSLHIGSRYSSSNYLNGHIKRLIYWPTHSSRL